MSYCEKRSDHKIMPFHHSGKQSLKRLFYEVAKIGKSGETEKTIHFCPFSIFSIFFDGLRSLGINTWNISFARAFERSVWHFNLNFDIEKVPL